MSVRVSKTDENALRLSLPSCLTDADTDSGINAMLAKLGAAHGADRAWIFLYDESGTRFRNTHEWATGGVKAFVGELQYTPVSMILWLHRRLVRGETVLVDDIDGMPRQARALRAEFRRQGNRSVLCVPMRVSGKLVGCLGYDSVTRVRRWNPEVFATLRFAGELALLAMRATHAGRAADVPGTAPLRLRCGRTFVSVAPHDIRRIEAAGDYTVAHLADGRSLMELRGLNQWQAMLPAATFVRISRSLIVNLGRVRTVNRKSAWTLTLDCGSDFAVGRAYRHLVRQHAAF